MEQYFTSKIDRVLDNWPGKSSGKLKSSAKSLRDVKETIIHRAVLASDRSPETFGEELRALNDVDEAIRNNCHR